MQELKEKLFGDLDFQSLLSKKDFKEDSVREVIILPILKELGYNEANIVRSKTLQHPFLKVGSNKNIPIKLIPDYLLMIEKHQPRNEHDKQERKTIHFFHGKFPILEMPINQ